MGGDGLARHRGGNQRRGGGGARRQSAWVLIAEVMEAETGRRLPGELNVYIRVAIYMSQHLHLQFTQLASNVPLLTVARSGAIPDIDQSLVCCRILNISATELRDNGAQYFA